tara:strand:- start:15370 stop:16221 length:852 start_codon:yes stop_codon:yes gene_type:complete
MILTGANGFIGSHLQKKLNCITVDFTNSDYNGNLTDWNFVESLPDANVVIHLAAFNSTKNFYTTPFDVLNSIITPTLNLIKKYPKAHFVYASSCETYASLVNLKHCIIPTPENIPLAIEDITNPRWCYASGKIAMESAIINHSLQYGNTYTILRPHNFYGPGQKNHFIPEFIDRLREGNYVLYGWKDTRSFCFIEDAVNVISKIYLEKNQIINIGSNEEVTILKVANIIMDILGIDRTKLKLEPGPEGSTPRRMPDLTKLNSLISKFEYTNLYDGLKQCIEEN